MSLKKRGLYIFVFIIALSVFSINSYGVNCDCYLKEQSSATVLLQTNGTENCSIGCYDNLWNLLPECVGISNIIVDVVCESGAGTYDCGGVALSCNAPAEEHTLTNFTYTLLCTGDYDWGYVKPGGKEICAKDPFNTTTPIDWRHSELTTQYFKIYDLFNSSINAVSNSQEWFYCNATTTEYNSTGVNITPIDKYETFTMPTINTQASNSVYVDSDGDGCNDVEDPEPFIYGAPADPIAYGCVGEQPKPTDTSVGSGGGGFLDVDMTNCALPSSCLAKVVSSSDDYDGDGVVDVVDSCPEVFNPKDEFGNQDDSLCSETFVNVDISNKSQPFLCYNDGKNSYIAECCYPGACENPERAEFSDLYNKPKRAFGNGGMIRTLDNFDKMDSDNFSVKNYVRIINVTDTNWYRTSPSYFGFNMSDYESISFDIAFNYGDNLNFLIVNKDASIQSVRLSDYIGIPSIFKWHHITIPLSDLGDISNAERIEINASAPLLNQQIILDNIYFGMAGEPTYYCSAYHGKWVDELDPSESIKSPEYSDDVFKWACDGVLGFGWTGTMCCGDDQGKNISVGQYNQYVQTGSGIFSLPSPRCSCDLTINSYDCPSTFLTTDPAGSVCYDHFNSGGLFSIDSYRTYTAEEIIITEKLDEESYKDTKGGCWAGYAIDNDFRVSDALNEEKYKDLLYANNSFYYCNFTGTASQNYITDYKDKLDMIDSSILVQSAPSCSVPQARYYCGFNDTWRDEPVLDMDNNPIYGLRRDTVKGIYAFSLEMINLSLNGTDAACCPSDFCWNGQRCVDGTGQEGVTTSSDYIYTAQNENNTADYGLICSLGEWKKVEKKYSPHHDDASYCALDTQCYYNSECYDTGEFVEERGEILDFYCENGNWSSRTKLLAETLLAEAPSNSAYTLFCDDASLALNNFLITSYDIANIAASAKELPQTYSVCVLSKQNGEVLIGVPLKKSWEALSSQNSIVWDINDCDNNVLDNESDYEPCFAANSNLYYNNATHTIIFSNQTISQPIGAASIFTKISRWFLNFLNLGNQLSKWSSFESIMHAENFKYTNILYNHIFIYEGGGRFATGVKEYKQENGVFTYLVNVEYDSQFNADFCTKILVDNIFQYLTPSLIDTSFTSESHITCKEDNTSVIMVLDPNDPARGINNYWQGMTSALRP